jgi:hypothetical protein
MMDYILRNVITKYPEHRVFAMELSAEFIILREIDEEKAKGV